MKKLMGRIMTFLAVVVIASACTFVSGGCSKTTKTTETKEKFFGGTEVKEKTVTETGDKVTVTDKKTEYNANGDKVKTETKTTGDTSPR